MLSRESITNACHSIRNSLNFLFPVVPVVEGQVKGLLKLCDQYSQHRQKQNSLQSIQKAEESIGLKEIIQDHEYIFKTIKSMIKQINYTVDDLDAFSLSEASQDNFKKCDILTILNRAYQQFSQNFYKKKYIDLSINPEKSFSFQGDEYQIIQALVNLLKNITDTSQEEGYIYIKIYCLEKFGRIVITNNKKNLLSLNDRYLPQLPLKKTKPPSEMAGTGLSIAYGIIHNHQGNIDYNLSLGEAVASTCIELPLSAKPI